MRKNAISAGSSSQCRCDLFASVTSHLAKRTATMPSDDRRILEHSFEHGRISFFKGGGSDQYRGFAYVMLAEWRMITAIGLLAGHHITLEATYRMKCARAHFMREMTPRFRSASIVADDSPCHQHPCSGHRGV